MNTATVNRLFDMNARVERIVHIGYMSPEDPADPLREFLEEIDPKQLSGILELNAEQQGWLMDNPGEACEILCEISVFGFLIEINGRIFRKIGEGHYEGTCASAIEYAYAAEAEGIDAAINAALDRMAPRLQEENPKQPA